MRRYWGEVITCLVFIALASYVVWLAWDLPSGGGHFPIFAAGWIIILSAYWLVMAVWDRSGESGQRIVFDWSYDNMKPMVVLLATIGYVLVIFVLGYFTATALFLLVGAALLGMRNWRALALTAAVLLPTLYAFFVLFLGTSLPRGVLI